MDSAWSKVFSGELLLSLIAQLKNFIEIGLAAWVMGMLRRIPKLIPRTKQDWWDWWREGTQSAIPGGEEKQQEQPKEEK